MGVTVFIIRQVEFEEGLYDFVTEILKNCNTVLKSHAISWKGVTITLQQYFGLHIGRIYNTDLKSYGLNRNCKREREDRSCSSKDRTTLLHQSFAFHLYIQNFYRSNFAQTEVSQNYW